MSDQNRLTTSGVTETIDVQNIVYRAIQAVGAENLRIDNGELWAAASDGSQIPFKDVIQPHVYDALRVHYDSAPNLMLESWIGRVIVRIAILFHRLTNLKLPQPKRANNESGSVTLPRLWAVFPWILPRGIRKECYEPSAEELKEDYLIARSVAQASWEHWWIAFAFTVRTVILFVGSIWVAMNSWAKRAVYFAAFAWFGQHVPDYLRALYFKFFGRLP